MNFTKATKSIEFQYIEITQQLSFNISKEFYW